MLWLNCFLQDIFFIYKLEAFLSLFPQFNFLILYAQIVPCPSQFAHWCSQNKRCSIEYLKTLMYFALCTKKKA